MAEKLTLQQGLEIQQKQIICISRVLNADALRLLQERAEYENQHLPADATGYDVWRGTNIDGFILNLANQLNSGKAFNDISPVDIVC